MPQREPALDDVRVAAERLRGVVVRTPLLYPATPGFAQHVPPATTQAKAKEKLDSRDRTRMFKGL